MKFRNKKTGQVVEAYSGEAIDLFIYFGTDEEGDELDRKTYGSIAELNEEWEDVPEEEWRDVLGFEKLYQVSNLGNVRTVKRGEATVMSQEEHWNGYLSVHLRNKGVERRVSVHRLVAEAFIPNPDGLRDVNHKNGIKTDNRVENLEWLSHSDNMKHAYKMRVPKSPLIKDEKIRKAVRAWAEANEISQAQFDRYTSGFSARDDDHNLLSMISFDGFVFMFIDGKYYTIDELCGEETE